MPKRKSPESAESKDDSKVTKHEKPAPAAAEPKPKQASAKSETKTTSGKSETKTTSAKSETKTTSAKSEPKSKTVIAKKLSDGKGAKGKRGTAKGKKEDGVAQNGDAEIYVSHPFVSVSSRSSTAPSLMSVRGQSETVRVKGN